MTSSRQAALVIRSPVVPVPIRSPAGGGIDTFVYHAGFGLDTINSFTATGTSHDLLQVDKSLFADWAHLLGATTQVGTDLVITLDATDKITLKNVALANFTSADAVFV